MNNGYHKNLVFTAACIGMCFFGVSMITLGAVLPSLIAKLNLSGLQTTSLVTFLPLGMLAGSLIFGPIVDRFGHKALLVPSCIIVLLGMEGLAFFESVPLLQASIVGIGLGRLAARKRDRAADAGIRTFAILCYATPVFFLGLVLKLIFAVWLNILPASGRSDLNSEMQFTRLVSPTGFYIIDAIQLGDMNVLVDVLRHAVLPAVALGLLTAGVFIRLVRTNVISTYNSGYVEAARSRGVSEKRLLNKHAWRPALIPIITVMGMQIALMLAGAVLTETTFEWKGLGFMLSQYLKARDFVAVQGIVILIAIIVAVVNFLVDVIAALIDPRVRY